MAKPKAVGGSLLLAILAATLTVSVADARRGGSFGSRGTHTSFAPRSTRLAPGYVPPVSRTMTSRPSDVAPGYAPSYGQYAQGYRPRFGFGSGFLTGLVTGGLLGSLFGHHGWGGGYGGYGGGGGLLTLLIQLAIVGGLIWLGLRLFRRFTSTPPRQLEPAMGFGGGFQSAPIGFGGSAVPASEAIGLTNEDQDRFERLLIELQDAFGHEDYGRLRGLTTPEVMSYLAEELGDNATHGRRNDVTDTRLLDAEVSEAWRENEGDYATIVLRYESIDVTRDRATNAVLSGDPRTPTTTTELWTFVRPNSSADWKVSAIQEA